VPLPKAKDPEKEWEKAADNLSETRKREKATQFFWRGYLERKLRADDVSTNSTKRKNSRNSVDNDNPEQANT